MYTFELDGVERTIDCTAYTPFIYSEEFLIEGKNGKMRGEDINTAVIRIFREAEENDGIPPMLDMLHMLWAFEKTANPKLPRFTAWLKEQPAAILNYAKFNDEGSWAEAVMNQLEQSFLEGAPSADMAAEQPE